MTLTEQLRKCKVKNKPEKRFYFHKWIESAVIRRHPEDPQKDHVYSETYAIIEDINNGEINYEIPHWIIFDVLEIPE